MALSSNLISQFVKATNDDTKKKSDYTVYGTVKIVSDGAYVKLDGADNLTPCVFAANVLDGDRVVVTIGDHKAVVTSNVTNPNLSTDDVIAVSKTNPGSAVMQGVVISDSTLQNVNLYGAYSVGETLEDAKIKGSLIDASTFQNGTIKGTAIDASTFTNGQISGSAIDASKFTNGQISGSVIDTSKFTDGQISGSKINGSTFTNGQISGSAIDASKFTNGTINASAINGSTITGSPLIQAIQGEFDDLYADKASIENLDTTYANIDFSNIGTAAIEQFYSTSGIIKDLVIGDTSITGELVGVTIKGDLIEGGTVVADKLVVKGEDGLYYKLNTNGESVEAQQTDYNSLNGSVITAKSITATKVNVDDLVAFDATIGGFNITEKSLYSGVKSSVGNTTRGVYLDNTGQISFGDSSNFITYYKSTDGTWKLAISADTIKFGANLSLNDIADEVHQAASDVQTVVDAYEAGELKGEDAVTLRIESSRGTVFKNNSISTVLSAVIYKGSERITNITKLHEVFGSGAYLEWSWQKLDENVFGTILSTDSMIGNDGFTLTISADEVDTKVTFMCELMN